MHHNLFGDLQYVKDDQSWVGTATLRSFATFGESAYADEAERRQRQEGILPLTIRDEAGSGPSPQQVAAFEHVRAHEAAVYDAVLQALFTSYREYTESPLSPLWDRIRNW